MGVGAGVTAEVGGGLVVGAWGVGVGVGAGGDS